VTKDGQIAGPKVIEHMVDTVLYFEGLSVHQFRVASRGQEPVRPDRRDRRV
jgi:predicted ATP-dependent serine protease